MSNKSRINAYISQKNYEGISDLIQNETLMCMKLSKGAILDLALSNFSSVILSPYVNLKLAGTSAICDSNSFTWDDSLHNAVKRYFFNRCSPFVILSTLSSDSVSTTIPNTRVSPR